MPSYSISDNFNSATWLTSDHGMCCSTTAKTILLALFYSAFANRDYLAARIIASDYGLHEDQHATVARYIVAV